MGVNAIKKAIIDAHLYERHPSFAFVANEGSLQVIIEDVAEAVFFCAEIIDIVRRGFDF